MENKSLTREDIKAEIEAAKLVVGGGRVEVRRHGDLGLYAHVAQMSRGRVIATATVDVAPGSYLGVEAMVESLRAQLARVRKTTASMIAWERGV